jgi:hypothetical protein
MPFAIILDEIQEVFFSKLGAKTGWGRNEIQALYKDAIIEVLANHINEKIPK